MDMCGRIAIEPNMNIDIFCQPIEKRVKAQTIQDFFYGVEEVGQYLIQ